MADPEDMYQLVLGMTPPSVFNDVFAESGDVPPESKWKFMTGGAVPSSPAVEQQLVYIGSTDHYVYALPV